MHCVTGLHVKVRVAGGRTIRIPIERLEQSIHDLKLSICTQAGIAMNALMLTFNGVQLVDNQSLHDAGIRNGSTINADIQHGGYGATLWRISRFHFDSRFDRDYTNTEYDGRHYQRGGEPYYRPYGYMKYGLTVLGKYESDIWLGRPGTHGDRVGTIEGEWPVAYMGTSETALQLFSRRRSVQSNLGSDHLGRILTTPNIELAEQLADEFVVNETNEFGHITRYKILLQTRVNPAGLERQPCDGHMQYYSRCSLDVRPYAILIKRVN